MQLPPPLRRAIEQELAACDPARLRAAAARLSQCYREGAGGAAPETMGAPPSAAPPLARLRWEGRVPQPSNRPNSVDGRTPTLLADDLQRAAYLAVRMPATFAAVVAALGWTREVCDNEHLGIRTMLDLGSGPGTALWAAAEVFPTLASATAVERDPRLIEIGRKLSAHSGDAVLRNAHWLRGDLTLGLNKDVLPPGTWDLVVCSYALNELAAAQRAELLRQAWARTAKLLVVVEPGTMAGFANILAARTLLLGAGATLAAPCPNSLACPMANGGDWCHFAARVERTADPPPPQGSDPGPRRRKVLLCSFHRAASLRTMTNRRTRRRASCAIPASSAATRSSPYAAKASSPPPPSPARRRKTGAASSAWAGEIAGSVRRFHRRKHLRVPHPSPSLARVGLLTLRCCFYSALAPGSLSRSGRKRYPIPRTVIRYFGVAGESSR